MTDQIPWQKESSSNDALLSGRMEESMATLLTMEFRSDSRLEEKLRVMKVTFGAHSCQLLRVNRGTGDTAATAGYQGLWRAHMRGAVAGGGAGEPEGELATPHPSCAAAASDSVWADLCEVLSQLCSLLDLDWVHLCKTRAARAERGPAGRMVVER